MPERALHQIVPWLLLPACACPAACWSQAQWPSRPILVTVGLQAATGSDIAVRSVTERLTAVLNQQFVIENLPGASGVLAAAKVAKSPPDGHALAALSAATVSIVPILDPRIPLDPFRDFVPAAFVCNIPSVLFVHPSVPVQTVRDFIRLAKSKPRELDYASGGTGSVQHLAMERFKAMAGVDLVHVPYKGSMQATIDVVSGRVVGGFQGISTVLQFVQNGRLRAIAWSGTRRSEPYPDLPTIQESGVPEFVYEPWTGLFAPAGTPREIVNRLNAEVRKVSNQPDFVKRWVGLGLEPRDMTPEQFAQMLRTEVTANAKLIKDLGLRAE